MKLLHIIIGLIFSAILLLIGFNVGRRYDANFKGNIEKIVVVDTVRFEMPQYRATSSRTLTVNVPRLMFVESSTSNVDYSQEESNLSDIPACSADSIAMRVDIESRIYEDSMYRAQVSGIAIGNIRPTLDWVEVYGKTKYTTQTITKRNRFAVSAGVGVAYTPQGFQPTVGVQVGVVLWGF